MDKTLIGAKLNRVLSSLAPITVLLYTTPKKVQSLNVIQVNRMKYFGRLVSIVKVLKLSCVRPLVPLDSGHHYHRLTAHMRQFVHLNYTAINVVYTHHSSWCGRSYNPFSLKFWYTSSHRPQWAVCTRCYLKKNRESCLIDPRHKKYSLASMLPQFCYLWDLILTEDNFTFFYTCVILQETKVAKINLLIHMANQKVFTDFCI